MHRLLLATVLMGCGGQAPPAAKPPEFVRMEARMERLEAAIEELRGSPLPPLAGEEPKGKGPGKAKVKGKPAKGPKGPSGDKVPISATPDDGIEPAVDDKAEITRKRNASRPLKPTLSVEPKRIQPGDGPPPGQVEVDTDIAVQLLYQRRKYAIPGPVPPGEYTIVASFEEGKPVSAGSLTVPPNGNVTISCDPAAKACSAS
jgi:hypothetical protein